MRPRFRLRIRFGVRIRATVTVSFAISWVSRCASFA